MPPTFILLHGNIHTLDPGTPVASAVVIRGDEIEAVCTDREARELAGPRTEAVDLKGRTVIPGLIDAHLHFEWYSLGLSDINAETPTQEECLRRVAERAGMTPKGEWIKGYGWNHNVWGGQLGTAAELDRVAPEHPVFLRAKSGHAGWANSFALRLADVTASTPDPEGGQIQRDPRAGGRPTGILFENAMNLVGDVIPSATPEGVARAMLPAMENAWRAGLTGVHDFDGRRCFVALQLLKARGQLGLRVVKNIPVRHLEDAIRVGLRTGFGDDWLRIGNVKVFADGALGPRTAAMIEPYDEDPENRGIVVTDKEELHEKARRAVENGLALAVHAIGDRANHDLLDVYGALSRSELREQNARLRHRAEHVQLLHPCDFDRLGKLGVIASMQPIHATSDMPMADRYWGHRSAGAYAWRTQLDAGAVLAFGSDAPVESLNPFWGIHAAVTRRRADGSPGPQGWYPEQRLTVGDAVRGFTLGSAFAGNMETRLGSLTAGKLADLLVIDRDIFTCDPMDIQDTRVLGTMVGGEWKFWGA